MHTPSSYVSGQRGSALIVALWTIGLLAMLVTSLAFDAQVETRITSYYRKRSKAGQMARSGIELAKLVMEKSRGVDPKAESSEDEDSWWYGFAKGLKESDHITVRRELGDGDIEVTIASERARRNVNQLKQEEEWEPILDWANVPEDNWPGLIEAFLDWTDHDDAVRVDGAETEDYYETLEPAYRARNGDLYTVDELLMIKGFSRQLLYGGLMDPENEDSAMLTGIARLLTVYGDKRINVNSAPLDVLLTLPDPDGTADLVAGAILEERQPIENAFGEEESNFFESEADLYARVPEAGLGSRREYLTTASSSFFRITSKGIVHGVERTVWCIVKSEANGFTILRWLEED